MNLPAHRALPLMFFALTACNAEEKGRAAAQAQLEAARAARAQTAPIETIHPPVRGGKTIPCAQLIGDAGLASLTTALSETVPLGMNEITEKDADATAVCSLVRGGTKPTIAQQEAYEKKHGRLGVLPGDEVCRITAYCGQINTENSVREWCSKMRFAEDEGLGFTACKQIVATGQWDIEAFRFFDSDTKCVLRVIGGPSVTDNETIRACAKTAQALITPASITVQ